MIRENNILDDPASTACTQSRMPAIAALPKAAVAALPLKQGHLDFQRSRRLTCKSQIDEDFDTWRSQLPHWNIVVLHLRRYASKS